MLIMKCFSLLVFVFLVQFSWAQVGIGTISPNEKLEVNGSIRMTDGNQAEGKVLVSDVDGTGSWQNITDGVKTQIIRSIGVVDPTLWSHPEGVDVMFDTGTETITVTNNTGDEVHYWNIIIEGDATYTSDVVGTDRYIKNFRKDGEYVAVDLGDVNSGWFRIIASDQNNELDGFIMNIVYFGQDFNGIVQYWDND